MSDAEYINECRELARHYYLLSCPGVAYSCPGEGFRVDLEVLSCSSTPHELGAVTGSILGVPVIEAKDWSEFTRVKATLVTDGNIYMFATCPHCGGLRHVVRPGDIQCGECGR